MIIKSLKLKQKEEGNALNCVLRAYSTIFMLMNKQLCLVVFPDDNYQKQLLQ